MRLQSSIIKIIKIVRSMLSQSLEQFKPPSINTVNEHICLLLFYFSVSTGLSIIIIIWTCMKQGGGGLFSQLEGWTVP